MAPAPAFPAGSRAAFLFDFFPHFFQGALNTLIYFSNLENSQHSWLEERKNFFIPKKAKDLKNPANYRPISLLEVFYKLQKFSQTN